MSLKVKLGDIVSFRTGKLNSNAAVPGGDYPFFTCSQETYRTNTFSFDTECILLGGNNANGVFPLKYFKGKFDAYQRTYIIEPIEKNSLNIRFLYYAVRQKLDFLRQLSTGAATKFLTLTILRDIELVVPASVTVQDRIAGILAAYDDLIENNSRRIAVLEDLATLIYEEWFVNYRFPGNESVPFVETELGKIPNGWSVKSADDAIDINPKVKVPKVGIKPFVPMGCLSEVNMLISDVEAREGNSGAKFRNGDTLFARITPCLENGKTAYVQFLPSPESVGFGSTEFIVLRSRNLTPEYVYLLARSDAFRNNAIKSMGGADGRQRVKEGCFASFLFAHPDAATLERFTYIIRPMFSMIHILACKNQNLRTTRDLLLPRLISGELDVSTLPLPEDMTA